jgi:hypothetical protein
MTYDFTKEERETIAEFVYSYKQDILIKSDATRLIDVLAKYKIIENDLAWHEKVKNKGEGVATDLLALVSKHIPNEQGEAIMKEYYKG